MPPKPFVVTGRAVPSLLKTEASLTYTSGSTRNVRRSSVYHTLRVRKRNEDMSGRRTECGRSRWNFLPSVGFATTAARLSLGMTT
ncbi:hypothetical protein CLIM01_15070 [Colletotrichum limetticola]|uniref:Uncharacterized protein n=1 Tax=Colletotrichum limetticola TaxID=1209924 RepID=A0ABQ9P697_9PEZI|nr:hypothetical protein CLIM01_15070 [Colletotrichum limetticola]